MKQRLFTLVLLCLLGGWAKAQVGIHSHNDYDQPIPFFGAYYAGAASIEADIYLVGDAILVSHDRKDLSPERTLRSMYLQPAARYYAQNGGSGYPHGKTYQLMIDLKTGSATIPALVKLLNEVSPECFNAKDNAAAVKVVLTGHGVEPDHFADYPDYIFFDGDIGREYTAAQRAHVALLSGSLQDYVQWDGKRKLTHSEETALRSLVKQAHDQGLKIRFWEMPDTPLAWEETCRLGIDFVNTDYPQRVASYLKGYK